MKNEITVISKEDLSLFQVYGEDTISTYSGCFFVKAKIMKELSK